MLLFGKGFGEFLALGFTHVLPWGYDHILFILAIFLLSTRLKSILLQCTVFTLAHSITLFLAFNGWIVFSPDITEPLIALSIVVAALENFVRTEAGPWRLLIVFIFGLFHGLGFAGVLQDLGRAETNQLTQLLGFNLGVELAQLVVVLAAYFGLVYWIQDKVWYRKTFVWGCSALIAFAGIYLAIQRI